MPLEQFRYDPAFRVTTAGGAPAPAFGRSLLALEQGQITMRDLNILQELAQSQYLTREQIQSVCLKDVSKSVARRRLDVLVYLGLISPIRWEEPREENTPLHRVAYCLALNGAKLLRHYEGTFLPWRPGMAQRHIRRVLAILAANEFRIQVGAQKPDLLDRWQVFSHPIGPIASFSLGGQMVILEAPRDEEEALQINLKRYSKWLEKNPLLFFLTPTEAIASQVFAALKDGVPSERLLFSTDQRAFQTALESPGYVWQWEPGGQALALTLV